MKGPGDQPDKAILVPFLGSAENSPKAMQRGSSYSHCPYFIVEYGVKSKMKELYQCIPRL